MTFEAAFNKIKEKFANVDASVLEDMAIQITISDEDCGGTFYAEVRDNVIAVEPYDYKDNDVVVDATKAALYSILDGKLTIDGAIEKGSMTAMGDLKKIENLQSAIKAPKKEKTTTKKCAVKKTVTKKETKIKKTTK